MHASPSSNKDSKKTYIMKKKLFLENVGIFRISCTGDVCSNSFEQIFNILDDVFNKTFFHEQVFQYSIINCISKHTVISYQSNIIQL